MGEVYLAQDIKLGRKVALKILPAGLAANQDRMRRFTQEARAAAALNHPNIAHIYEIGSGPTVREGADASSTAADETHFIAMEFIDGYTLREHLGTGMKLAEVLEMSIQAASALAAAHSAGITHRDVKPENIMVRRDGIVKAVDFGLAKLGSPTSAGVDSQAATKFMTDPGTRAGTVVYMSPEQALGIPVDARTDVFSLGAVLYEMVAGRPPFDGSTSGEALASLLSDKEPQPLARYSRDVPAELERIVTKALRKIRDERYQTMKDILLDLQSLKQELEFQKKLERSSLLQPTHAGTASEGLAPAAMKQTAPVPSVGRKDRVRRASRNGIIALAGLLIVAAAIATYVHFLRATGDRINSIAILPFANANKDPNTEYFSDGVTENIINSLSQLPRIKVLARTTVFRYKGRESDPQKVGNELGVDALLTGRVSQQGETIAIQADLVRVADGAQLWGSRYNKKLSDIFTVQNEIASEISETLRLRLNRDEQKRAARQYTDNVEAYQLYLKGRYESNKFTPEGVQKAIDYYNQAIAIDPTYALAYAGQADLHSMRAHTWIPPKESYPKAKWAAEKALALDDTLAEAHDAAGGVKLFYDWDYPSAEYQFKRAIELNPNCAHAYSLYSTYFKAMKRYREEIAQAKRGQELDPLSAFANMELGEAFYQARRYDEAIEQIRKTLELDSHFFIAYHVRARAYEQKRMYGEAIADCQEWAKLFHDDPPAIASLGHVYASMGNRREAERTLDRLQQISTQRYFSPYWTAVVYAGLGDLDRAFHYLEKAFEDRYFILIWINSDPRLDNLHSDRRFADLVRRMGL